MIIRIVKMTFRPECTDDFQAHFQTYKKRIRSTAGCRHLELLRDTQNPDIFFTYSFWKTPEHLDTYRRSVLFGIVWKQTKTWFAEAPEAWSVNRLEIMS